MSIERIKEAQGTLTPMDFTKELLRVMHDQFEQQDKELQRKTNKISELEDELDSKDSTIEDLQDEVDSVPSVDEYETIVGSIHIGAYNAQHLRILESVAQYLHDGGNPTELERMIDKLNKEPYTV